MGGQKVKKKWKKKWKERDKWAEGCSGKTRKRKRNGGVKGYNDVKSKGEINCQN